MFLRPFGSKRLLASPSDCVFKNPLLCINMSKITVNPRFRSLTMQRYEFIFLNIKYLNGFSRPFPVGNSREKSGKIIVYKGLWLKVGNGRKKILYLISISRIFPPRLC